VLSRSGTAAKYGVVARESYPESPAPVKIVGMDAARTFLTEVDAHHPPTTAATRVCSVTGGVGVIGGSYFGRVV
jgi:hypothetical protein